MFASSLVQGMPGYPVTRSVPTAWEWGDSNAQFTSVPTRTRQGEEFPLDRQETQSDAPWPDGQTLSPTTTLEKRIHGIYVRPHLYLAQPHGPKQATSPLSLSLPRHKQTIYPCLVRVKFWLGLSSEPGPSTLPRETCLAVMS